MSIALILLKSSFNADYSASNNYHTNILHIYFPTHFQ